MEQAQAQEKKTRGGQPFRIKKKPAPKEGQRLTMREILIADLLAEGLTNKQIASQLGISDHTVKFHVNNTMRKLGAQTRAKVAVDFVTKIKPEIEERFECGDERGSEQGGEGPAPAPQGANAAGRQGHQARQARQDPDALAPEDRERFAIVRGIAMRLLAGLRDRPPSSGAVERAKLVEKAIDLLDIARVEQ